MMRRDEINRKLDELADKQAQLTAELQQREESYKDYLSKLVEADIAKPATANADAAFKDEVLQWLGPRENAKSASSIKGWVLSTIGECPSQLTPADLRSRFTSEFGAKRVASVRQYLTKPFGLVQKQKADGKLVLTKKGQAELEKLKRTERG